jgi:hypothetical protein
MVEEMCVESGYKKGECPSAQDMVNLEKQTQEVLENVYKNGGVICIYGIKERVSDDIEIEASIQSLNLNIEENLQILANMEQEIKKLGMKAIRKVLEMSEQSNIIKK